MHRIMNRAAANEYFWSRVLGRVTERVLEYSLIPEVVNMNK